MDKKTREKIELIEETNKTIAESLNEANIMLKKFCDGDPDMVKRILFFWTESIQRRCDAIDMSINQFYSGEFADIRDMTRNVWELEALASIGTSLENFVEWMKNAPSEESIKMLRSLWNDGFANGVYSVLSGDLIDKIPERLREAESQSAKKQ